jgi:dTDP-4-dehydrorhamnose 3,5-epimerase
MLAGAIKDTPTGNADWEFRRELIEGVRVKDIRAIVTRNGVTTEIFRADWGLGGDSIEHAIRVTLLGHAISAWHLHERQTDHVFVTDGAIRLVLFDDRDGSPTRGRLDVLDLSPARPMLVVVPPGIWHGLQNRLTETSALMNLFDRAYRYGDPDEWRLPPDTDQIPYRF